MAGGDLTSYLASRYLVAEPTKPTKKRKRKHNKNDASNGLLITDDDDLGWSKSGAGNGDDDDDDDDAIRKAGGGRGGGFTVAGSSAEFRKTKKSNWKTLDVGGGATKEDTDMTGTDATTKDDGAAEADAIISRAAAETEAALAAEDEAPVVADADAKSTGGAAMMSDGTHAGLQSAASVVAQLERRRREERDQYEREKKEKKKKGGPQEEEVVYRDATGRRVDIALRRQEVRNAAKEAERKAKAAEDALKGDVQKEEARQRREQLADAALMPLARGVDDEEMNAELKQQERWNDPMAQFLERREEPAAQASTSKGKGASRRSLRPIYKGPAAPNRYGIRPGYRWDGVDRSNGFEADRFKAINRRERNKGLEYAWQTDE